MEHSHLSQIYLKKYESKAAIINGNGGKEKSKHSEEDHAKHELIHTEALSVDSFLKHIVFLASKQSEEGLVHFENKVVEVSHHSVDEINMQGANHQDVVDDAELKLKSKYSHTSHTHHNQLFNGSQLRSDSALPHIQNVLDKRTKGTVKCVVEFEIFRQTLFKPDDQFSEFGDVQTRAEYPMKCDQDFVFEEE